MAEQKMYVPPHRRSTIPSSSRFTTRSSTTSRLESLSPARQPRQTSFEGTTSYCQHLHLQSPSVTRSSVLVESQSVRRGYGRFGGPPPALSQTTEGRSITALVSDTEHDEEEDLDSASAVYSNSTNLARTISSFEPEIDLLTRTHTPLPTREWASVDIRVAPLPPKPSGPLPLPVPLLGKIGPLHSHGNSTRPLAERIGRLYIPPSARFANGLYPSRDDTSFWQSQTLNGGKIQPPRDDSRWWQKENLRRQKINFHSSKTTSQPGPSRRCMIQPTFSQVAVLFHHLGEKIDSFKMTDLEVRKGEGISGVKYAGSYKWIEGEEGVPTLAVPAVPDIWDPPEIVGKLTHDKDIKNYEEFPDYASALLPPSLSTLEPLFLSLTSPDELHDVDLATGRNNLRKIWSALRTSDNHHNSPWRIDIEYINCGDAPGLVILERFEPPQTLQYPQSPNGYRQSFQEATTHRVLDGSDRTPGCNRIISYHLGGIKMMVKFDTPAFRPHKPNRTEFESGVTDLFDDKTTDGVSTMDGLDFDDPVYNGQTIRIRHTTLTPPTQDEYLSIKTKHYNDAFDAEYHFPQMFFSQTPHVIYARHQYGDFKFPILHYDLFKDQVPERIEEERQETIDKVAAVLRWVVGLTRKHKRGLGLVWDGKSFSVCEREKGPELSAPVKEMIMDVRGSNRSVIGDISVRSQSAVAGPRTWGHL